MARTIKDAFSNGKAFIAFITAGDPDLDSTEKYILEMERAGADLIEIGIPGRCSQGLLRTAYLIW